MSAAGTSTSPARNPRILAIDAGGTMTDTIIIDANGDFVIGKAQTTPHDESEGFMASLKDATSYWKLELGDTVPALVSGTYSPPPASRRTRSSATIRSGPASAT